MDYERGGTQRDIYSVSDVENTSCPLCGCQKSRKIYQERGVLGIVGCFDCGLVYVNPRLKNPEQVYWGDANKYYLEAKLIFEGRAAHHRDSNYITDLRLIHKYKPSGKLLDIGTNMGFFLRNAKNKGWDIYGVEPSPSLSEMAMEYFGLNVKTAFLEDARFENGFFDIVTMTDVFEHLTQPKKVLSEISRILKPDGIIFIKVPNALFNLLKLYGAKALGRLKNYDIFDSYEHVVHYSQKTLTLMLESSGFKVIDARIGKPIQLPVWHNYVGQFYQYPTPWRLDFKRHTARTLFYIISLVEYMVRFKKIGFFAPNIILIAKKAN